MHNNDISLDEMDEETYLNTIKKNHILRKKDLELVMNQYEILMIKKKLLDTYWPDYEYDQKLRDMQ